MKLKVLAILLIVGLVFVSGCMGGQEVPIMGSDENGGGKIELTVVEPENESESTDNGGSDY
jgi:hypothetical protein